MSEEGMSEEEEGGAEEKTEDAVNLITTVAELEGGIFNLSVALCQAHATTVALPAAKALAADYLETLVIGLRTPAPETPTNQETK